MTYTSGTPLTQLVSEGTGLVFIVIPRIFDVMGPIGHILAPMLFISILFAGITSSIAELEPLINSLCHKIGWSRKNSNLTVNIRMPVILIVHNSHQQLFNQCCRWISNRILDYPINYTTVHNIYMVL